ncbi:MAG: peptidase, partial [Gallionella sp.]
AYGLPQILQEIGHAAPTDDSVALLFKTHPHPDVRLAQLGEVMDSRFDVAKAQTLPKRLVKIK